MSTSLEDLDNVEQVMFILATYPNMSAPEKFVLVVAAHYSGAIGATLGRLAELTGMSLQTTRRHLRQWASIGVIELSGTGKDDTARFRGAQAWLDAR